MGFRNHWVAVNGRSVADALEVTALVRTGERSEASEPGFGLIEARDGWVIVIADGWDSMNEITREHAVELSAGARALYFETDDSPMATQLVALVDGQPLWSIEYNLAGDSKLEITGSPPPLVNEVVAERQAEKEADADCDYIYDITATVTYRLIGFRHDMEVDGVDDPEPVQFLSRTGD